MMPLEQLRLSDIFHPMKMPEALTFVVYNKWGRRIEPITRKADLTGIRFINLNEYKPVQYSFSSLSFVQGGVLYSYPLEEGKLYRVEVSYHPLGLNAAEFTSKKTTFRYMRSP